MKAIDPDPLNGTDDETSSTPPSKQQQQSGSALGVSSDEQKEVFNLTSTTEKSPVSKRRKTQSSIPSRQKKTPKKSTTISVQTEWTWKDMEMLEQYRIREEQPEPVPVEEDEREELEQEVIVEPEVPIPKISESPEQAESTTSSLPELPILTSVGPPPILQYNPESKQKLFDIPRTNEQAIETELRELGVHIHGHIPCEFCGQQLLKWPTIVEQEKFAPSQLFCCSEYREFVEAVLEMQKEENQKIDSKQIDIQPHAKVRSRRARQLAEERAKTRVWERHMAEQKRLEEQAQKLAHAAQSKSSDLQSGGSTDLSQAAHKITDRRAAAKMIQDDLAAKMRTLTYQLSNLKFVEEGWTLQRPPDFEISSDEDSEDEEHIIVPRDLSSSILKKYERPLIQRFYKDGSKAAILFPNGTGCVYYPSGNTAISISEVARAMLLYTAFTDEPTLSAKQLAQFDPFGNGYCNFMNGDLRLQLTALEGVELNVDGSRRRRWNWWTKVNTSLEPHVHAPPFQPILFHLNKEIVIKICSQEKLYMKFSTELIELKFKVGARLQVNNVNNLPSTQKSDPYENLLKKKNIILTRLLKNIQYEAQQYIRSEEQLRTSQQTTIINLQPQHRTKQPIKKSLFPPIRQNEEKIQNNRKIYRSVIVT
ncbi:unnamed protein product [Rotaria sordida]|uniref:FAM194 C-terminal domain-containing protein n=1 Tax=Rotaria sordida TaxID=392033 RepID=A0A813PXG1_9BILA|nr:unnamed protein product [Rotaria sordida]CAF0760533.1 unnamed protein product [Rotaria sordida]CAF0776097.1 unnamed protein product [Rotaria sordida]CAF0781761.1 unnamed protein product [Rotaria sordida]CAF3634544.1 unnamed protein product [Rotaria sordida]